MCCTNSLNYFELWSHWKEMWLEHPQNVMENWQATYLSEAHHSWSRLRLTSYSPIEQPRGDQKNRNFFLWKLYECTHAQRCGICGWSLRTALQRLFVKTTAWLELELQQWEGWWATGHFWNQGRKWCETSKLLDLQSSANFDSGVT